MHVQEVDRGSCACAGGRQRELCVCRREASMLVVQLQLLDCYVKDWMAINISAQNSSCQ